MRDQIPEDITLEARFKRCAIFLNGSYPETHADFYKRAAAMRRDCTFLIAADGALEFFDRAGLEPDLIIGDFDSVSAVTLAKFPAVRRETFDREKDSTDGELAVRYALKAGMREIEIFGAVDTRFETDQMLANILLLKIISDFSNERQLEIASRMVDHSQHIYLLKNSAIELEGEIGDGLSIIPLSSEISLTVEGTKWELRNQEVKLGSTLSLRNEFASKHAKATVKGLAVIVHRYTE